VYGYKNLVTLTTLNRCVFRSRSRPPTWCPVVVPVPVTRGGRVRGRRGAGEPQARQRLVEQRRGPPRQAPRRYRQLDFAAASSLVFPRRLQRFGKRLEQVLGQPDRLARVDRLCRGRVPVLGPRRRGLFGGRLAGGRVRGEVRPEHDGRG
jgi:hypothetical protein